MSGEVLSKGIDLSGGDFDFREFTILAAFKLQKSCVQHVLQRTREALGLKY